MQNYGDRKLRGQITGTVYLSIGLLFWHQGILTRKKQIESLDPESSQCKMQKDHFEMRGSRHVTAERTASVYYRIM